MAILQSQLATETAAYFLKPVQFLRAYKKEDFQADLIAGMTVAIILIPQAIAYALIAELPVEAGLYTAVVSSIVGALWGSSNHLHTGATNASALLVLATLLPIAEPGTSDYWAAAGLLAIMVGIFRLAMGLARMGILVNFVSDSLIIGFSAGAGVLIFVNQLKNLFRLKFPSSPSLVITLQEIVVHMPGIHLTTLLLGIGVILILLLLKRLAPKLPAPLIALSIAATFVVAFNLNELGVPIIGDIPRQLPPLANIPLFDLELIGQLSSGALAVGAIGLVEAISNARAIASLSGQRLDTNQEFVGQGLANIASGFLSGYVASGSPSRSIVNYHSGAKTPMAALFSGVFALIIMLIFAPAASVIPNTGLAAVLILIAIGMINYKEILRIWKGTRGDAFILILTFVGTLFLPLQFAVLTAILASLAFYILKTSIPRVETVLPDEEFRHFFHQQDKPECPQLTIMEIHGDLYFGAVSHIEKTIIQHSINNPGQRFLLLRMQSVEQCDISGIHTLENILRACREQGGDMFLVHLQPPVLEFMKSTQFFHQLGEDHFLAEDQAISHLFYRILDPSVCIYECEIRAFKECQNLPKQILKVNIPTFADVLTKDAELISCRQLWEELHTDSPPLVIDVRESREFQRGHVPNAKSIPLPKLADEAPHLPHNFPIVLVCRTSRRSQIAVKILNGVGIDDLRVLEGGIVSWESSGMFEAIENYEAL